MGAHVPEPVMIVCIDHTWLLPIVVHEFGVMLKALPLLLQSLCAELNQLALCRVHLASVDEAHVQVPGLQVRPSIALE
jgi:hypothetical protein